MSTRPPLEPDVADVAPRSKDLTPYDYEHLVTYLRLLDADDDNADWQEVAQIVLRMDPSGDPGRAYRAWRSHLARARWMTRTGYRLLLLGGDAPLEAARRKRRPFQ
jgi:hypothetical protein